GPGRCRAALGEPSNEWGGVGLQCVATRKALDNWASMRMTCILNVDLRSLAGTCHPRLGWLRFFAATHAGGRLARTADTTGHHAGEPHPGEEDVRQDLQRLSCAAPTHRISRQPLAFSGARDDDRPEGETLWRAT